MIDETFESVIEDLCIVNWTSFYKEDPRRTVTELIDWEVETALDPAVSSAARRLQRNAELNLIARMNLAGYINEQSGEFFAVGEVPPDCDYTKVYRLPSRIDK